MAELEEILVRLHDQAAADAGLAIPNVFVVDGIAIDVFPNLTIAAPEVLYADDERDFDAASADLVLVIAHQAVAAEPSEKQSRTYARALRKFLIEHRLLGDNARSAGSALLQGSRVSRQRFDTLEHDEAGWLYTVETTWQIDWRAPRRFAVEVPIVDREIEVISTTPQAGGTEILVEV